MDGWMAFDITVWKTDLYYFLLNYVLYAFLMSNISRRSAELHVAGRQNKHRGPTWRLSGGSHSENLQIPAAAQSEYNPVHAKPCIRETPHLCRALSSALYPTPPSHYSPLSSLVHINLSLTNETLLSHTSALQPQCRLKKHHSYHHPTARSRHCD